MNAEILVLNPGTEAARGGLHDGDIEIDQIAVIAAVPLRPADPVRIVTSCTGGTDIDHVPAVQGEALVAEDAGPVVAPIAQGVCDNTLRREVGEGVVRYEQGHVD